MDAAKVDVRLWCFACARGGVIDSIIWQLFESRGWPIALDEARARFTCKGCGSSADVLLVPATRPKRDISNAPTDLVAGYFHKLRAAAKAKRRR